MLVRSDVSAVKGEKRRGKGYPIQSKLDGVPNSQVERLMLEVTIDGDALNMYFNGGDDATVCCRLRSIDRGIVLVVLCLCCLFTSSPVVRPEAVQNLHSKEKALVEVIEEPLAALGPVR